MIQRIGIFEAVTLNGGDAAIMLALEQHLAAAFPHAASPVVFDEQRRAAAQRYPETHYAAPLLGALLQYPAVPWLGWRIRRLNLARWCLAARTRRRLPWLTRGLLRPRERRKLAELAELDLAVATGGTYLVEHYNPWARIAELRILLDLGVPVILYTQSLGPFTRPELRAGMRALLDECRLVLLRDERSDEHARELGGRPRTEVVADGVFAFARPVAALSVPDTPEKIAISVRPWAFSRRDDGSQAYEAAVRAFVTEVCERRGASVTFLSTCQGVPEYAVDDARYAEKLVAELPAHVRDRVRVDTDFHHPLDLPDLFAEHDVLVSTRMHAAILALCGGVPVLPIAYEFKTRELFAALGLERHVLDIEDVEGDALARALDDFWSDRARWGADLPGRVVEQQSLADRAAALMATAVLSGPTKGSSSKGVTSGAANLIHRLRHASLRNTRRSERPLGQRHSAGQKSGSRS